MGLSMTAKRLPSLRLRSGTVSEVELWAKRRGSEWQRRNVFQQTAKPLPRAAGI